MFVMKTQYIITLGSRSNVSNAKPGWRAGRFDETDYANINTIVRNSGFPGSTVTRCKGFWNGQEEDSVQIVILADDRKKVDGCAHELRGSFQQQAVMLSVAGTGEILTKKK